MKRRLRRFWYDLKDFLLDLAIGLGIISASILLWGALAGVEAFFR